METKTRVEDSFTEKFVITQVGGDEASESKAMRHLQRLLESANRTIDDLRTEMAETHVNHRKEIHGFIKRSAEAVYNEKRIVARALGKLMRLYDITVEEIEREI